MKRIYRFLTLFALIGCFTAQAQITSFPYTQGFDSGMDGWTVVDQDADGHNWFRSTGAVEGFLPHGGSHYATSWSYDYDPSGDYDAWYPNNFLISPAITVPTHLTLSYWVMRGCNSYADRYALYVCTDTSLSAILATTPLEREIPPYAWTERTFSLDSFAGQTVYIVFRHYNSDDNCAILLDDVALRTLGVPEVDMPTTLAATLDQPLTITANVVGAVPISYSWSSLMQGSGNATMTANNNVLTITYSNDGVDTITLVASNSHGSDTAITVVNVADMDSIHTYPYFTSFEPGDDVFWQMVNSNTNGWAIGTATHSDTGSHSLYISNNHGASYAYNSGVASISYAYRAFDFDSGSYTYSFDWKGLGNASYHYLRAFLAPTTYHFVANQPLSGLSSSTIPNSCIALDNGYLSGSDTWHTITGSFDIASRGIYNMVFVWINNNNPNSNSPAAIDNISVRHTTCPAPTNLTITNASFDELTLGWTSRGPESEWAVSVNNGEWEPVYTNPYTISNLTPGTSYNISLRAVCGYDDTSLVTTIIGTTACSTIDSLPWSEGFESYATTSNQAQVNCWDFVRSSTTSSYISITSTSNRVHTGSRSMRFSGHATTPLMAILPPFSEPISGLELSFWCLAENTITSGNLRVGYITDPNDSSTFVQTAFITNTGHTSYTLEEVTFVGAPDSARIAIQQVQNGNNDYWWWIDDLEVHGAPECTRPNGITISNVTQNGATFTINDPAAAYHYHFYLIQDSDTLVDETIYDTIVTIDTLTPGTTYTVVVSTICNDSTETQTISNHFSTRCTPINSLPWSNGFEDYATANQAQINCWDIVRSSSANSHVSIVSASTRAHSGSKSLRFNGNASTPLMVILPEFEEPVSNLELSFWCLAENTSTCGNLRVGYITNPADSSTFVQTAFITNTGHTSYTLEEVTFSGAPDSARIAIQQVQDGNNNYWWWIDDLDVHVTLLCDRPVSVTANDVTENEATIAIYDTTWVGSYHLVLLNGTDTIADTTLNDTSFYINTLTPATIYTVNVNTICPDGTETSTLRTTFNTLCGAVSVFPWLEDFNSDVTWICWTSYDLDNNTNTNWSRNSNGYATSSFNQEGNANDWLITPVIAVPENVNGLSLSWKAYGNSYGSDLSHLTVRISNQGTDTADFTDVIYSDYLPDHTWSNFIASLSNYAGDSIHVAFIHDSHNDNGPRIDSVGVSCLLEPKVSLPTSISHADVGIDLGIRAILNSGDTSALTYSWSNTLAGSTLTAMGDSVSIAYTAAGIDTVTVVATNSYGSDTASAVINVRNCYTVSTFPFTEGFESGDLGCWNTIDANNDGHNWYFGSEEYSLYLSYVTPHSGNECLISDSYSMTTSTSITPDNYLVSPAIAVPATGITTLTWYDYSYRIYPAEHYSVYVSTTGTTAADFLATTAVFDTILSSDSLWHQRSVDLSTYAGQTINIAFRHHDCYDEYFMALDDISVTHDAYIPAEYTVTLTSADTTMGTVSPAGSTTVTEGDSITVTAIPNEGYHFINWTDQNGASANDAQSFTFIVTADISLTANFAADSTPQTECLIPTDVAVSNITATSASISWTANGNEQAWIIAYGSQQVVANSNPYTLADLAPSTSYTVKVQALCGEGITSDWSDSITFTTLQGEGIDDVASSAVKLYPNPATTVLNIEGLEGQTLVAIMDVNGRVCGQWTVESANTSLDISRLSQGAYFVRITGAKTNTIRKLVVK